MDSNDNEITITNLYSKIKLGSCKNPTCSNEIKKFESVITNYNKRQYKDNYKYWICEYTFDKSKIELEKKQYFRRHIYSNGDCIEIRPIY